MGPGGPQVALCPVGGGGSAYKGQEPHNVSPAGASGAPAVTGTLLILLAGDARDLLQSDVDDVGEGAHRVRCLAWPDGARVGLGGVLKVAQHVSTAQLVPDSGERVVVLVPVEDHDAGSRARTRVEPGGVPGSLQSKWSSERDRQSGGVQYESY